MRREQHTHTQAASQRTGTRNQESGGEGVGGVLDSIQHGAGNTGLKQDPQVGRNAADVLKKSKKTRMREEGGVDGSVNRSPLVIVGRGGFTAGFRRVGMASVIQLSGSLPKNEAVYRRTYVLQHFRENRWFVAPHIG